MGKSQSRMEEARTELATLEKDKAASPRLRERLLEYIRICRAEGELKEAADCLDKLLILQQENKEDQLEIATTMYILGNSLRLQLQAVPDPSKPNPFPEEKDRMKAYARAEDMLVRSLEIRSNALKNEPDSRQFKIAVARTKSALAMIQNSYGGNQSSALAQHEGALVLFAEFPLACDPEGWTFVNGAWISSKSGSSTAAQQPPNPSFPAKPPLIPEDSRSFRNESRSDQPQFRSYRAATTNTNTHALQGDVEEGSFTEDDDAPTTSSPAKRSTKWRLVLRYPQSSDRRPSAFERLRRIGSFQGQAGTKEAFEGIVQKIDLEPGHRMELGLPVSVAKKAQLAARGFDYITVGPKDKLAKVLSERHCILEEDKAIDDGQVRWTIIDPNPASGKYRGILVNGVRVNRAPLRPGDLVQIGSCSRVKMGSCAPLPDKAKQNSKDPFINGIEYLVERVITTIDDTDVSSVAPASLFEASDNADTAFRHFHLLAVAAQMNLNGPTLTMDQTSDFFALAVKNGVPFHLWDSWIYSELSKTRLIS